MVVFSVSRPMSVLPVSVASKIHSELLPQRAMISGLALAITSSRNLGTWSGNEKLAADSPLGYVKRLVSCVISPGVGNRMNDY